MPTVRGPRPAWALLRLALPVLAAVLMVGCLLQVGKGAIAVRAAAASSGSSESPTSQPGAHPAGQPGDAPDSGPCAKDRTPVDPASRGPLADSPQVAVTVPAALADGARSPAVPHRLVERIGPAPPSPDLADLCVLRI